MSSAKEEQEAACITVLIIWLIGAFCLQYVVEFWASYYKGQPVDFSFLICLLCALIVSRYSILLAVFTFIASYFVSV